MKTQKKNSLGSIVTSSILALTLATGLVPAGALAFADDAIGETKQVVEDVISTDEDSDIPTDTSSDSTSSTPAITSEVVNVGGATGEKSDIQTTDVATDSIVADTQNVANTSQSPIYNNAAEGITSVQVPLTPIAEKPQAVGSVEFGGIQYTINPNDPTTVAATGLASIKPEGDVQIQSQVAISGDLYPVTAVKISLGGGAH